MISKLFEKNKVLFNKTNATNERNIIYLKFNFFKKSRNYFNNNSSTLFKKYNL